MIDFNAILEHIKKKSALLHIHCLLWLKVNLQTKLLLLHCSSLLLAW